MNQQKLAGPAALALALALTAGCAPDRGTTPSAQASMADSAEYVFWGIQHNMVYAGMKQAELKADSAFMMEKGNRLDFRGSVRLVIFDSIGVASATLTSNTATYSLPRKSMEAHGNVIVTSTDGRRLETSHLVYDQVINKIRSDSAFVLIESAQRVEGRSFTSDPSMKVMKCDNCTYTGITPPGRAGVDTSSGVTGVPPSRGGSGGGAGGGGKVAPLPESGRRR